MNSYWCSWERNWLNGATLSAGSETVEQPVANLVSEHVGSVWRALATTTWFGADFGTARPVRHLSLHGLKNVTPAATLRWRLSNVALGNGELLDTRLAVFSHLLMTDGSFLLLADGSRIRMATTTGADPAMNVERNFDQYALVLESAIAARYSQVDIVDPTNADGWLDIGAASIGDGFVTERNFEYGIGPKVSDTRQGEPTPGGQTYLVLGPRVRSISGYYRLLPRAQALGEVQDLLFSATRRNALFIPYPNDALQGREMVYGLLPPDPELPQVFHGRHSWAFTMTERL